MQRQSPLKAHHFVELLMFANKPCSELSLEDLANDFLEQHAVKVSKQALQERFNDHAVSFMKALLKQQLSQQLSTVKQNETLKYFNRIRIKDSTRFAVPKEYAQDFKGQGGIGSAAQISIQYEYDLLTGTPLVLELTSGCRNDQQDSKETLDNIRKGDLLIRDLAYTSQAYLKHVSLAQAYYLNRLNPKWTVFDKVGEAISFSKLLNKLNKYRLPLLELDAFINVDRQQVNMRLIVSKVSEAVYQKRIKSAQAAAESKGYGLSDALKTKAWLNLYITNIPAQWLAAGQVRNIYSLRCKLN